MSKITELLEDKQTVADPATILNKFPWIVEHGKKCILSPDSDGLLCGLFMARYFNWQIVGYYDGKVLLIKEGVSAKDDDCVFLDIEIYRSQVKSVGHHMLAWNAKNLPPNWGGNFSQCLQPNLLRGYTGKDHFRLKYPLATIHLLIALAGFQQTIDIPVSAIAPLFFVDGTFNVLYSYPENVLNWLKYLHIEDSSSPLRSIFMHEHFTIYSQMLEMDKFFRRRDLLTVQRERGDKFVISDKDSSFKNIEDGERGTVRVTAEAQNKVKGFLGLLAETSGWPFREEQWTFQGLKKYRFEKSSFEGEKWKLNNGTFSHFVSLNPLSWAMTNGTNIEFTKESPDSLP